MMDWKKAPKSYIENIEGSIAKDVFLMAMYSGDMPFVFSFTPTHMKRIMQWFKYNVDEYEKQYGPISSKNWEPAQISPFMPIKKPKKGGETI